MTTWKGLFEQKSINGGMMRAQGRHFCVFYLLYVNEWLLLEKFLKKVIVII